MRLRRSGGAVGRHLQQVCFGLGLARVAFGAGALLTTRTALGLLGFTRAADAPETRAVARLAGTRDVALGSFTLAALEDRRALRAVTLANACVDAADAITFAVPLAGRQGIDRAALLGASSATAASVAGFWLASRLR
jgi:uncharacterized protein DUF4267